MNHESLNNMKHGIFIAFLFMFFPMAVFGQQSPTQSYLNARDEAIRKAEKSMTSAEIEAELNGPLKNMVRDAIGPFDIEGFPKKWEYNIESLTRGDLGFYNLDGLQATSLDGKTKAVVSTVPLLRAWLESQSDVFHGNNIKFVIKTGRFYANVIDEDAYAYDYAEIPVITSNRNATAGAILVTYGSDVVVPDSPHKIALTIIKDNLAYIIIDEIRTPIKVMPVCIRAFEKEVRSSGGSVNPHDKERQGQYVWIPGKGMDDEKVNDKFLKCFRQRVASQKYYPLLVKQARSWIAKVGNKPKFVSPTVDSSHPERSVGR